MSIGKKGKAEYPVVDGGSGAWIPVVMGIGGWLGALGSCTLYSTGQAEATPALVAIAVSSFIVSAVVIGAAAAAVNRLLD